jgi:hypothetical protein
MPPRKALRSPGFDPLAVLTAVLGKAEILVEERHHMVLEAIAQVRISFVVFIWDISNRTIFTKVPARQAVIEHLLATGTKQH